MNESRLKGEAFLVCSSSHARFIYIFHQIEQWTNNSGFHSLVPPCALLCARCCDFLQGRFGCTLFPHTNEEKRRKIYKENADECKLSSVFIFLYFRIIFTNFLLLFHHSWRKKHFVLASVLCRTFRRFSFWKLFVYLPFFLNGKMINYSFSFRWSWTIYFLHAFKRMRVTYLSENVWKERSFYQVGLIVFLAFFLAL